MKNNVLKFYIAAFYILSTFMAFAQPGSTSDNGGVDNNGAGDTTPAAPIDDYVWVIAAIALVYVFFKLRAVSKQTKTA